MSRVIKSLFILSAFLLVGATTGFGGTFYVQPGGVSPNFANLTDALTTIGAYAGTDHIIVIKAGTYTTDDNLTVPANIAEIYGEDQNAVIFEAPLATDNFLITGGAQANFKLHDMTVDGYNSAVYDVGGTDHDYSNLVCRDGVYGIIFNGCTSNTVTGCCFINNSADNGWDNNLASTWNSNYWDDATATIYYMGGGASSYDANPIVRENNPETASTNVAIFDEFDVNIMYSVPACAEPTDLAAYEFTVTWNAADIEVIPAGTMYDENYLGSQPQGALYTNPAYGANSVTFAAANFTNPGTGDGRLAIVRFKVIGTGASSISIASVYVDSNGDTLYVESTPLNMSFQDNDPPEITLFTQNDPVTDDTYSDNGPNTIKLNVDIQAEDNFALDRIQYRFDSTGSWINLVTGIAGDAGGTAGMTYINITGLGASAPKQAHKLFVRARDDYGNYSNEEKYSFFRDITGPVLDSFKLADLSGCAAPGWTNDSIVAVTYFDDGTAASQQFYVDGGGWLPVFPYLAYPQPTVSFAKTEATHSIYVHLFDAYGNLGNQTGPVNIILDLTPPTLTGPFSLAGWPPPGPAKTNLSSILGYFNAWDANRWKEVASQTLADMTDCSKYVAANYPVPVTLTGGPGMKKVYFAYADSAGNFATPIVDSIEYDPIVPAVTAVVIKDAAGDGVGGDDCTDGLTVNVTVDFADADIVWVDIDDGVNFTSNGDGMALIATGTTFPFTFSGPIPSGTTIGVNVVIRDNAGNASAIAVDSILLDTSNPTVAGVVAERTTATVATVFPLGSNTAAINLKISGLAADVTHLVVSEDGVLLDTIDAPGPITDPYNIVYTWQSPLPTCGWHNVFVRAMDCSGNKSSAPGVTSGVYFDLWAPVVDSVKGPALTNTVNITVNNWVSDCLPYQMRISEDPGFATGTGWIGYAASAPFALSGEGTFTVYFQVSDYGGNVAGGSFVTECDLTAPTGTFAIYGNADAAPGYTNTLTVKLDDIVGMGGATQMRFRNSDGSGLTAWLPLNDSVAPWTLAGVVDGIRTVQAKFRDAALNETPNWTTIQVSIMYDATPPSAPSAAIGIPGGSIDLHWAKVPDAMKYRLRYNFSGDYPIYANPNPPAPNPVQGFSAGPDVSDTSMNFAGPQQDKYHFSIWSIDSAGNVSGGFNSDVLEVNYILGDYDALDDECINFIDEFVPWAAAYNKQMGVDPEYFAAGDIAPTDGNDPAGYPIPDGWIDFDDLIVLAINYDAYHCTFGAPARPTTAPAPAGTVNVELFAEVPDVVTVGTEFTVPLTVDPNAIGHVKGYHLVFDYNSDVVELVSVTPGEIHTSADKQFFYVDNASSDIDISGVILETEFVGSEIALLTFRAKAAGDMRIEEKELDLRDRTNAQINGTFTLGTAKVERALPTAYALSQNYPNPFNPSTMIELALPVAGEYSLSIYDITGRMVETFSGYAEAGYVNVEWNATGFASGVYLYKVVAGNYTDTKKMVLLK